MHRAMKLKAEQKRLYDALPAEARCFVRVCATDDALWVCDLPRRYSNSLEEVEAALLKMGFSCRLDAKSKLWHIDLAPHRWMKALDEYPSELPPFPVEERYHAAYALCRLWMLHPAPWMDEHLPTIRRVIKLAEQEEKMLLRSVCFLHEQAACDLRKNKPPAHAAGRILARWLMERREEE